MKKFTIIAVLLFYSLAAFGVSLNYFYCCGKLKSVTVNLNPPTLHKCSMKNGKDCCKNEKVDVKVSTDQNFSKQIVFEPFVLPVAAITNHLNFASELFLQQAKIYTQQRPPPLSRPNLNILNCSFLI